MLSIHAAQEEAKRLQDEHAREFIYRPYTNETKETFLFVKRGDKGNVLYIELTPDGEYYEVNSGGIFKNSYTEKRRPDERLSVAPAGLEPAFKV